MIDYNPDLDITAGELRKCGGTLPDTIPDCAWVPRVAVRWSVGKCTADGNRINIPMTATIDAPFRWIEISGRIEQGAKS